MSPSTLKVIALICFVICAVLLFVAWERYQANAGNVAAMNQMRQSSPLSGMMGGVSMKPATPAATKYALVFAVLAVAGGVVCLIAAGHRRDLPISND